MVDRVSKSNLWHISPFVVRSTSETLYVSLEVERGHIMAVHITSLEEIITSLRKVLLLGFSREEYPSLAFLVRPAELNAISVEWTNGPSRSVVESIVKAYPCRIDCTRYLSMCYVAVIIARFCADTGIDQRNIVVCGDTERAWVGRANLTLSESTALLTLLYETDEKDLFQAFDA